VIICLEPTLSVLPQVSFGDQNDQACDVPAQVGWSDPTSGIAGSDLITLLLASPPGSTDQATLRQAVINAHIPLVRYVAAQFTFRSQDYPEFVQVGTVGLIRAIDRFDASKGSTLSTYAFPFISGEIRHFIRDEAGCIHIPRRIREQRSQLLGATAELGNRLGRDPRRKDLALASGLTLQQVDEAMRSALAEHPVSLDVELLGDLIAQTHGSGAEVFGLDQVEDTAAIAGLLQVLCPRSRRMVEMYYLDGMSQSAIGSDFGVAKVTVCRTLQAALRQMRAAYEAPAG